MKKLLLILITFFSIQFVNSQTWNFIGSSSGIASATEVDLEIGSNGNLFVAYTDAVSNNKVTVRKFNTVSQTWQAVGATAFSGNNAFDVQMCLQNDSMPAIAYKRTITIGASNYNVLEIYRYTGTTWQAMGLSDPILTNHSKDFSLRANTTGQLLLTFYNQLTTYTTGLVTINLTTLTTIGPDLEQTNLGNAIASCVNTGNNVFVTSEENDAGDFLTFNKWNGIAFDPYSLDGTNDASELKMNISEINTNRIASVWSNSSGLFFKGFNSVTNTFGTFGNILAGPVVDFDFDMYQDDSYVFFRSGTTCGLRKVTSVLTPTNTFLFSGTALAPGTATSLAIEKNVTGNVIAYINGGMCYVKEENFSPTIEDVGVYQMCEGSAFNSGNFATALLCLEGDNYTHPGLTMTVTSQNTAIIPQSAISTSAIPLSSNLKWKLIITNTNDVVSPTLVDIQFELFENGVSMGTALVPITVNPKPNITINIPNTSICNNAAPVNLSNGASPGGGNWIGAAVSNNILTPSLLTPGSYTLVYTKTNNYGCTSTESITGLILPSPVINLTTEESDCENATGAASISISSGNSPYSVYWSTGSINDSVEDLSSGQYYVTVTDESDCSTGQQVNISSSGLQQTGTITNVSCNDDNPYGFYGTAHNGAVDITVSGNEGPVSFLWSNGATTEDISTLGAGQYEVQITDSSGCVSAASYTVTQPSVISAVENALTTPSCGVSNGGIDISVSGGTGGTYSYSWVDNASNFVTNNQDLTAVEAGIYAVYISNGVCGASYYFPISNLSGPVIALDSIVSPANCSNTGSILLTDIGNTAQSFLWSNSQTTLDAINLFPGTYSLEATGTNGCITSANFTVTAQSPEQQDICLVTVDTNLTVNLVVWEKPVSTNISHYNIYRETSQLGNFQYVDSVNYENISYFIDSVASPSVRSWRYKITAVDVCNVESDFSSIHKTIHLATNIGLNNTINLAWDSYEGFTYAEFKLWRYTNQTGWQQLSTLPANIFAYTDTPPVGATGLDYLITIIPPYVCLAEKARNFNSTRSNRDKGAFLTEGGEPTGINENSISYQLMLYPNPASEEVYISYNGKEVIQCTIINFLGEKINENTLKNGMNVISVSDLAAGVYFLNYSRGNEQFIQKLVVE